MPSFFRAVAVDYDGTLAEDDRPHPRALTALAELRRRGRRAVLCTGRIMTELREVFPDVDQHFDAIVAENGGVVVLPGRAERAVNEPVPAELANALRDADVPVRSGMVLLATRAAYDGRIREEITRLGLDAQLIRNRGELMVVPAGVTKGVGLLEALGELEVSRHSTVAIGDAENDHALLHACEVGVAVANAVDSLRQHADICLTQTNGAGVAAFLLGPLLSGDIRARPARWRIELGRHADGTPATLPGSRINVLVAGGSGAGKSYVAGILIERLSALGYAVCVFDCEGDHATIQRLRGVVCVGGPEPLPTPAQLGRLIRNRFTSVIIDLSLLPVDEKRSYFDAAMAELRALRYAHGLPHWIVVEEADQLLTGAELPRDTDGADATGYCLVTHRPGALSAGVLHAMDAVIALPGAERYAPSFVRRRGAVRPFQLQPGHALLSFDGTSAPFLPGERLAPHVRHLHKYLHSQVPPGHRFFFAGSDGEPRAAGNLIEFRDLVHCVAGDVLHHHLHAGDFSRWIYDVMADDELGARFRSIERWYRTESGTSVDQARDAIITAIDARYPGETEAAPKS
jgi:HAD superfamily hydrolase (TIGR01484 family)